MIGAGSWGTTIACLAARSTPTRLWARRPELAAEINESRQNSRYLPGLEIPELVTATDGPRGGNRRDVCPGHGGALPRIPGGVLLCVGFAGSDEIPVLSLTKGIEQDTLATMTQVVSDASPREGPFPDRGA